MIFESHAHYDDAAFDDDRDDLIIGLPGKGVGRVVNVASGMDSCKTSLELAQKYSHVYCAIGVHPSETEGLTEESMELLKQMAAMPRVVAIGEIGLDYHWPEPSSDRQKEWFIRQLELAKKTRLPVIIHSRDAAADTLDIMRREGEGLTGGVIHCFSYSKEMAREYLDMGFYIGVGGVLTFKNAKKLKEVVADTPIEKIVLETDSPYLAPEPYRGRRNDSSYLKEVVRAVAQIKEMEPEEVETVTWNNAVRLFRMEQ